MIRKIKAWFQKHTMFGQYVIDQKVLNNGLKDFKNELKISEYKLWIYPEDKDFEGNFKKMISIYNGSKTTTFIGYSNVQILADIRNSLETINR